MNSDVEQYGFGIARSVLSRPEVDRLLAELGSVRGAGHRGSLGSSAAAGIAQSKGLLELVRPHAGKGAKPVRVIYFDKSANANWFVAWHQDLTLAVRERVDISGFGPWSMKDGVPHVQAPVELLERMLALRVHLDDCDGTNGALRVLPGTHRLGRLSNARIQELRTKHKEVVCSASAGDVMLMRPLLLHASKRSHGDGHRRILHIEYAGFELPAGLHWVTHQAYSGSSST